MIRGRVMAANDEQLARWRGYVWTAARNAWGAENPPTTRPVAIDLAFYVMSNRTRRPEMRTFDEAGVALYWLATTNANDIDKLTRAVLDALTQGKVWQDDGLVVDLRARAYFASPPDTPPGVQIEMREL